MKLPEPNILGNFISSISLDEIPYLGHIEGDTPISERRVVGWAPAGGLPPVYEMTPSSASVHYVIPRSLRLL